jgi:hypothetical protein
MQLPPDAAAAACDSKATDTKQNQGQDVTKSHTNLTLQAQQNTPNHHFRRVLMTFSVQEKQQKGNRICGGRGVEPVCALIKGGGGGAGGAAHIKKHPPK